MFRQTTSLITSTKLSQKLPRIFGEATRSHLSDKKQKCLTVTERCVPARRTRKRRNLLAGHNSEPIRGTWF